MPRFDSTGPTGAGPMTGRGFGFCGMSSGWNNRFRMGCRMGGCCYCPQVMQDPQKVLAEYRKALERELKEVRKEEEKLNQED